MTRYLCCLAVLGVGALPDWATAYHPCWVPPPCGPAPGYPMQFYLVPPAAPVYEVPLPPPSVHVVPAPKAAAVPTPAAPRTDAPAPVRPAADLNPPAPLPPTVSPKAAPKTNALPAVPDLGPKTDTTPKAPDLKLPELGPKATPDVPPLILPDPPAAPPAKKKADAAPAAPTAPSLVLPPDVPVRSAVPTPAPAPDADPKRDAIPPLVLPPDGPGAPSGVIPPTTARSSPLAAAPRVEVFAVAGRAAGGALRRVGFFNHTDRAIPLTIEGRPVTLPAKSFLHAELPPSFRWSEAGGPPRRTTVPADSPGVDVLFRAGE
jgi:hypothetical protein